MQCHTHRCLGTLVLALSLCISPKSASADVTGSILGVVRDSSQAVIVGAEVVAMNVDTNFSKTTTTGPDGQYWLLSLPVGKYRVTATATGFQRFAATSIDLKVDDQLRIDVLMTLGSLQQEMSVEANSVQVNTESTQLGDVIESQKMVAMPLNGRSYLDLLGLQAGVVPISANTMNNDRPVSGTFGRPGNVSVNGQSEVANNFMVNGGDVNEAKNMGAGLLPNLESVAEFRLLTNSFDAEYGKHSGAVMNTITKSGTNEFHGTAFEFLRNDKMDARGFFDPLKASLRRNQFGYAAGGPFWKNKLFWFTDFQGTRQAQGASTGLLQLPNVNQRTGVFNASLLNRTVNGDYWAQQLTQRLGYAVAAGEPYSSPNCTTTATCVFPGGVIPQRAFSKVAVNMMKYIPTPNIDPNQGFYADASQKGTVRDDKMGQRVDFFNEKTGNWSFYYHFDDSTVYSPLSPQGNSSAVSVPGTPVTTPQRAQMFVVSNIKTFSSSAVNEARLSVFRTSLQTAVPDEKSYADTAALGYTTGVGSLGIVPTGPAGYPNLVTPLYFNNFTVGPNWLNMYQSNNTYMVSDGFSKVVGAHSLKFGGEFRYYQVNVRNICGPYGYFTFNGQETGNDFADYLIGAPATYVQCSLQVLDNRANYGGAYAQDSWKIRPNLTLNLGLRWEAAQPWSDTRGELETIIPGKQSQLFPTAPLGLLVPGDPGVPNSISPTRWGDFAPRVGLAYSPDATDGILRKIFGGPGKTSIRAAFGLYYLGPADTPNFGIIGDAPFGLYWASTAPPLLETPFQTRATGVSQGAHFPFTPPVAGDPANATLNFKQYYPLSLPSLAPQNVLTVTNQYNVSIQRSLSKATVLTLAYVGNQGHHLPVAFPLVIGDGSLCLKLIAESATPKCGPNAETSVYTRADGSKLYGTIMGTTTPGLSNQDAAQVVWARANQTTNMANSSYNAAQVTLERKARDITFMVAYTFSKSMDNITGLKPTNYHLNHALSPWDMTHNFVASYVWNVPFDRAFGGAPKRLTEGWTITGITRFATGLPITLGQTGDLSLTRTSSGYDVPNVVGPVTIQDPRQPAASKRNMYFLPSAFSSEVLGQLGNANIRFFHGPGLNNTDFGLAKTVHITEAKSILIRAEYFNIFNHAQFQNPVGNFASSQFGQVTSAQPPRIGQVSAKFMW
jgi:carboxypeptidase family protein/TonB-dependent receptor-like protein